MNKSILQNGDLFFMSDESEFAKTIIETTDKLSHVGIYFDGMIYHASRKLGVAKQNLDEYLKEEQREVFIFRYPQIDAEIIKERAERYLGCEYNHSCWLDSSRKICKKSERKDCVARWC
ncbi:MAG: hypothetical protein K6E51_13395 [Treponema sp.]|nr:hypothetical protein [Treponema sp.]